MPSVPDLVLAVQPRNMVDRTGQIKSLLWKASDIVPTEGNPGEWGGSCVAISEQFVQRGQGVHLFHGSGTSSGFFDVGA